MKVTSEAAFEALIEKHLIEHGGYVPGDPKDFDPDLALIPADLLAYVEATQEKVWAKQQAIHGDALAKTLIAAFDKATTQRGVLYVLRHGFKFYGSRIRVATFRPAHGLNPDVEADYAANVLKVVRQVHHDPKAPGLSLDLTLFLNGIPVVTAELKNALTNQKSAHAQRQYRTRDAKAPIFRFKRRALVNFAVGSDEVYMTTRLAGSKTFFLPFNRGHGTAAGNPPVEGKHRTHYLWEQVWESHSLLDIFARFMHLQVEEKTDEDGTTRKTEKMIFPRFHQLDCVRALVAASAVNGAGKNYLVQHSAGSGKSNSIAWLAHRLASLHDDQDAKVYDGVVVITDRTVLDQQIQEVIWDMDHKQGVVQKIDKDSAQLAAALEAGVPIIISTLHKFGFIADKIEKLPDRRYAVIVDEAHSSQSGDMATNLKEMLSDSSLVSKLIEEGEDLTTPDQLALRAALFRGPQKNLSFFAFTATPKFKTLELFGHKGDDGKPAPFHLYSMRQAIQEGFILDVLLGYTTYQRYFKLVKAVADDPDLDKKRAARALARFVSLHPVNVAQKVEVIVEHFRACVMPKLGGRAKGMVVTGSRLHAVKFKLAVEKYVAEKGYADVKALVAFSGEVKDPDNPASLEKPYTEPEMNKDPVTGKRLAESALPKAFASSAYNVLIVANKYQTGFDQPLLCAMYVDKRLSGIQCVQTLSRLNRSFPGKETFVLDFVNEREEILESFQQFYEGTTVADSIDPQRLYELQGELDAAQVYKQSEIDLYASIFFKPKDKQKLTDNARLSAALDPAKDRFDALEEEPAEEFRGRLVAYCNLYAFLAQIVPFSDVDLEKLYVFGKKLLMKIAQDGGKAKVDLGDDVALHYYRLQKTASGDLGLAADGTQVIYGPGETGTGKPKEEQEKLSRLIELINDRFGTEFDVQDLIGGALDQMVGDPEMLQQAEVNDRENFRYVFDAALDDALLDRHAKHGTFIDKLFSDKDMLRFFRDHMLDEFYKRLPPGPEGPDATGQGPAR